MATQHVSVIIVGGGMIGATAAAVLGHAGIDVALLDARRPASEWSENSVDLRVSALTKASQNILDCVGAWSRMLPRGVCAYKEMRVWDGKASGELHFDCADTEFNELGHIVENRITTAALWEILDGLPSVQCITPAVVQGLQLSSEGGCLQLTDDRQLTTDLVIAADGRDSLLRQKVGIGVTGWPYHQHGLVATITTEKPHRATAWQRFLEEGPLAFLPLYTGQCSIVWTLSSETAQHYLRLTDTKFLQKLEQASAGILGKMVATGPRAAFPLTFQYANRYTDRCFALIGDAAHAMHPLAGQGANAGLLDAAALTELIVQSSQRGIALNSHKILRKYERWRKGDNMLMLSAMDVLNKTFAVNFSPIVLLRSAGMNLIDHNNPIKNLFNRHAMGLRDDVPEVADHHRCW